MPDPTIPTEAALRAEVEALRAELAAQQRTIPALPFEHDGKAITWRPWQEAPVPVSHIDSGCHQCDHPGPHMITFGLVGEKRPTIRYNAHRCPSCQEMRVYQRYPAITEIAYNPPRQESSRA